MNVGPQVLQRSPFLHHLTRAKRRRAEGRTLLVGLTLTSMVDMFSLLVIFLLQTFSASPELIVSKNVVLPSANSSLEIRDAVSIVFSKEGVFLDQKLLGGIEEILKDPAPLTSALESNKNKWMNDHPKESFQGEITVQADKSLPSVQMSQLLAILPSQNFGSMQLAVIGGGSGVR